MSGWYGVSTDNAGRVTGLSLEQNGLAGMIPDELGILTALQTLDMSGNSLTGSVPTATTNLVLLEVLDLSDNPLEGTLPAQMTALDRLRSLRLDGTQVCAIPSPGIQAWLSAITDRSVNLCENADRELLMAIYDATGGPEWDFQVNWGSNRPLNEWQGVKTDSDERVVELYLVARGLTGRIPPVFGDLSRLQVLNLSSNALIGAIPPELSRLDELTELQLTGNDLTGTIPPEFGDLANLEILSFHGNELSGSIPKELGNLRKMNRLYFSSNNLTGSIPRELGNLANLDVMYLDANALSGSIPPELGSLANLTIMHLRFNRLSGSIPVELGNLGKIESMILSDNALSGTIPPELSNLKNLKGLFLDRNALTGRIPSQLADMNNLLSLYLWGNKLTGSIPAALGDLANLTRLHLHANDLAGSIPPELGKLGNLVSMVLHNNPRLSGRIPVELTRLNLDRLQLDGTQVCIPAGNAYQDWLEGIQHVRVANCAPSMESRFYLTQAVQSLDYTVPLVAGEPALLRVFVTSSDLSVTTMPAVRADFYRDDAIVHTVDIAAGTDSVPREIDEGDLSFSANALIPGTVVTPDLEAVLHIDPENTTGTAGVDGIRVPATGRRSVIVRDVPPLHLTMIPLLWYENPDESILTATEGLTTEDDLFKETRDLLPVRDFELTVRDAVWTSLDPTFANGSELLREIDALKKLDGATGHYMGILLVGGGIAIRGKTISVAAFNGPTIAHELGHNMSLLHAPCNVSTGLDAFYPNSDGSIGAWGIRYPDRYARSAGYRRSDELLRTVLDQRLQFHPGPALQADARIPGSP